MALGAIPDFNSRQFVSGLRLPFHGLSYLFKHNGLKRYAILPLIVNVFLYAAALGVFFYFLWNWQIGLVDWQFWGPTGRWLSAAVNWMGWLLKLMAGMIALAAAFFTFTAVGMVLTSPLNDMLSEKVENVYCQADTKMALPLRFTAKAGMLSAYDSLCNLGRQLLYTVLCLPLLLIPVVGFVPMFLVGAYFAGFGFIDTAMARNFLRLPHKKLMAAHQFWQIVGFGVTMQALFAVPLIGMLLMPVGVVSGTLAYCTEEWELLFQKAEIATPPGFIPPKRQFEENAAERKGS